jgi:crotonobetainyl-CoA:carnitine CoA-transferase CaiB-like acyl-CoA transferase
MTETHNSAPTYPIPGPLNGVKVIAFEHAWAAPYGTMMLADMGADVVKVEPPGLGDHVRAWTRHDLDGISPHFLAVNRNKRSIVLDLKNPDGVVLAKKLICEADVVVSNFAPGKMEKLGLGYEDLQALKPELVYCSVSGFGSAGPYRDRRAYDLLIQAEGGLMSVTGSQDGEVAKVGTAVVDIMAAMVAAFSIVSAVRGAEREGKGRRVDISMLDVAASVMSFNLFSYGISGEIPRPLGTAHPLLAPYEVFQTSNGPIAIAILTEAHWATFCSIIGRDDLRGRPEFALAPMRVGNREALNQELRPVFAEWDQHELVETMAKAGLACAQVNDVSQLLEHPQLQHRGFFTNWEVRNHKMVAPGAPWRMDGAADTTPDSLPAVTPGLHAESVLADWCSANHAEIEQLRNKGALG